MSCDILSWESNPYLQACVRLVCIPLVWLLVTRTVHTIIVSHFRDLVLIVIWWYCTDWMFVSESLIAVKCDSEFKLTKYLLSDWEARVSWNMTNKTLHQCSFVWCRMFSALMTCDSFIDFCELMRYKQGRKDNRKTSLYLYTQHGCGEYLKNRFSFLCPIFCCLTGWSNLHL